VKAESSVEGSVKMVSSASSKEKQQQQQQYDLKYNI
jgi:hypothetical protein